jgi:GntR family transcriptional regulator
MAWNLSGDRPIWLQLMEGIQVGIVSGKYPPGTRLPSVRDLAAEAAVNPNTMQKALTELERSGLVYSQRTSGRFITEDGKMIQDLKNQMASEQIREFLERMERLGFTRAEVLSLMKGQIEEK